MKLILEINPDCQDDKPVQHGGAIFMFTPKLNEDFWRYRVKVGSGQAVVGFPKFSTIGIGFAVEKKDWNTNLPYLGEAEVIYRHIRINKGKNPKKADCLEAIRMIQAQARKDAGK